MKDFFVKVKEFCSDNKKYVGVAAVLLCLIILLAVVTANGKKDILAINIKPEVVDEDDVEMLEDLVLSAVNEALRKAEEETANKMGKVTGGMNIPGLF